jgi:phosphoenolpyruvate carboxylase
LRREKLVVADEIENARAYMEDVFLVALPKLYARWEHDLGVRPPSFLRLGSWIGGDRDGNPFVNAETLDHALSCGATTVLGHYLESVHHLGAEISISSELAHVPQAVLALAGSSGDLAASRADEPYRRALSGVYARLAATYVQIVGEAPPRPSRLEGKPYSSPDSFRRDLVAVASRRWRAKEMARWPAAARWGG